MKKSDIFNKGVAVGLSLKPLYVGEGGGSGDTYNIDKAIIIQQPEAKITVNEFVEVGIDSGNNIGYAGEIKTAIVQGYIAYPNSQEVINSIISDMNAKKNISDYAVYDETVTLERGTSSATKSYTPTISTVTVDDAGATIWNVKMTGGSSDNFNIKNIELFGILLTYSLIDPPSSSYRYGKLRITANLIGRRASSGWIELLTSNTTTDVRFRENEYNATVRLEYERA